MRRVLAAAEAIGPAGRCRTATTTIANGRQRTNRDPHARPPSMKAATIGTTIAATISGSFQGAIEQASRARLRRAAYHPSEAAAASSIASPIRITMIPRM